MNTYKQLSATCIQRQSDNACIPTDPGNTDYRLFLTEQAAGATVLPMDIPNPNVAILAQIAALEATMTPRRMREAIMGVAGAEAWVQNLDAQVASLRSQIK